MSVGAAMLLIQAATLYGAVGFGVGVAFLLFRLDRLEPAARGAHAFRPLMLPGLLLLWPLVAWRWARA